MSLEIRERRGILEVLGKVSEQHVGTLNTYFDVVLEQEESFIVSLEKVTELDLAAARFFEKLFKKTVSQNKVISLIGRQNPNIAKIFDDINMEYILCSDRV